MKKSLFTALVFLCAVQLVTAQRADLMLKTGDKGLFLEHKVVAKESYYAIGRLYNVHPAALASYNKLDMKKGLVIGQLLRIPLTDTNFTQKGNKGTPVYYKAGENEELTRISSASKNVSIENLRKWNGLSGDRPKAGAKLIVGFVLSKELPAVTIAPKPVKEEPVVKTEEKPAEAKPVVSEETKPVIKEEPKKVEPVFAKTEEKPLSTESSYFKYHFEQQVKTNPVSKDETVTSGIFKTTSGWLDSKYYLLMDKVQPGTIVKITNPSNSKTIYAKVLGEMAGIRQNEGFDIRISSAAASVLQVTEQDKFIVKVNY